MIIAASEIIQYAAAAAIGVCGFVIFWLSLRRHRAKYPSAQEMALKSQAELNYWRTFETAVDKLGEVAADLDAQLKARNESLTRLTEEAKAKIERLEKLIAQAEPKVAAQSGAREQQGNVVNFKAATAALVKRNHRRVYEAFDSGHSIQEISKETGMTLGELELILALRDKPGSQTGTA